MTDPRIALLTRLEQAARSAEPDVLRDALRWAIEELMEADVTAQLGAAPHERADAGLQDVRRAAARAAMGGALGDRRRPGVLRELPNPSRTWSAHPAVSP